MAEEYHLIKNEKLRKRIRAFFTVVAFMVLIIAILSLLYDLLW